MNPWSEGGGPEFSHVLRPRATRTPSPREAAGAWRDVPPGHAAGLTRVRAGAKAGSPAPPPPSDAAPSRPRPGPIVGVLQPGARAAAAAEAQGPRGAEEAPQVSTWGASSPPRGSRLARPGCRPPGGAGRGGPGAGPPRKLRQRSGRPDSLRAPTAGDRGSRPRGPGGAGSEIGGREEGAGASTPKERAGRCWARGFGLRGLEREDGAGCGPPKKSGSGLQSEGRDGGRPRGPRPSWPAPAASPSRARAGQAASPTRYAPRKPGRAPACPARSEHSRRRSSSSLGTPGWAPSVGPGASRCPGRPAPPRPRPGPPRPIWEPNARGWNRFQPACSRPGRRLAAFQTRPVAPRPGPSASHPRRELSPARGVAMVGVAYAMGRGLRGEGVA